MPTFALTYTRGHRLWRWFLVSTLWPQEALYGLAADMVQSIERNNYQCYHACISQGPWHVLQLGTVSGHNLLALLSCYLSARTLENRQLASEGMLDQLTEPCFVGSRHSYYCCSHYQRDLQQSSRLIIFAWSVEELKGTHARFLIRSCVWEVHSNSSSFCMHVVCFPFIILSCFSACFCLSRDDRILGLWPTYANCMLAQIQLVFIINLGCVDYY